MCAMSGKHHAGYMQSVKHAQERQFDSKMWLHKDGTHWTQSSVFI